MSLDFPSSPTLGQVFGNYVWDGEKWAPSGAGGGGDVSKAYVDAQDALRVRYDAAQALTAAQQTQARANICAAPFDAMAYSGMQINGSMEVSQENGSGVVTLAGQYILDGFSLYFAGTMAVTGVPALTGAYIPGFSAYLVVTVQTAQPSLGGGDVACIFHQLEGYRTTRLQWGTVSAKPITIAFWSAHNRVGTYTVSIRNAAADRCYAATYTQNFASAAEYKTITIPGDTIGTWGKTNAVGLSIAFIIASGAGSIASSANTWLAGGSIAAPGQVNGVAATSDNFRITGVTILPGTQAPTAAQSPLIMRPYDQELVTCQRYYQKYSFLMVDTASAFQAFVYATPMRAAPTLSGGGAGFVTHWSDAMYAEFYQTTRSAQTIVFNARL